MKKLYYIHKAEGIAGEQVKSARINAVKHLAYSTDIAIEELNDIFERDAGDVVDFLTTTLPQGTVDRVIIKLLQKKASSFIVPMFSEKGCKK